MRKPILISFLFFLPACTLSAQEKSANEKVGLNPLDSLHHALAKSGTDTVRLHALINLMTYYWEVNSDSTLYYADESISLAKKLNYRLDEGKLIGAKAELYNRKGLYAKSLDLNLEALNILNDRKFSGDIGSFWRSWYGNENPHEILLLATADVTRTFSFVFASVGNYQKALSMSLEAKAVMERFHWNHGLFLINFNNAGLYLRLGKPDSALFTIQEGVKIDQTRKYKYWDGVPSHITGIACLMKKEYGKSMSFFLDAIRINSENNNIRNLSQSQNGLARVYLATGNPVVALQYASAAILNASSVGYADEQIVEAYTSMSAGLSFHE